MKSEELPSEIAIVYFFELYRAETWSGPRVFILVYGIYIDPWYGARSVRNRLDIVAVCTC